ncbi:MAG: hypothetical protein R3D98_05665 [Candidatus Krumholzibacteriia bacterium]
MSSIRLSTRRQAVPVLLSCLALATVAVAADPVSVLLKGHDQPLTGWLRQVSDSHFFLQGRGDGNEYTYEFPGNQIVSVDGEAGIPASVAGDGRLIEYDTYEVIRPDGDVEFWSQSGFQNGANVLTELKFGAREDELPRFHAMEAFDKFGNRLEHRLEPRGDGFYYVVVTLAVPAGYRETVVLSLKTVHSGSAVKGADGTWSYTFNPDFPEDRVFNRKVRLPEGATLVDTTPSAAPWPGIQPPTLFWRRYYPKNTVEPMVITYRLP